MKHEQNDNGAVSPGERARWVARYRASGTGLKRFAAAHGLPPGQLHYWVYAPPPGPTRAADAPVFQELRLTGSPAPPNVWTAEIALKRGDRAAAGSRLHYGLDITLREDQSRVRTPGAARVLGTTRRVVAIHRLCH